MIHPAQYYGERKDHWRITERNDAPPQCAVDKAFLYIVIFPDIVKVGVSTTPAERLATHERARRVRMESAYLILLDRAEAFDRERIIKYHFGEGTPKGRRSEWFSPEHLPEAVLVMRDPVAVQWLSVLDAIRRDFARDGHDCRFELKSSAALWRDEFAA